MIKALVIPLSKDMRPLSELLWAHNIPHRISEKGGEQVLWVARQEQISTVNELYQQFLAGELEGDSESLRPAAAPPGVQWSFARFWQQLLAAPVVSMLILLSLLSALLFQGAEQPVFHLLRMGSLAYILESGDYWRLVTPIFLHFGLMHLAFNLLMLWVFGHQIEQRGETLRLVLLVLGSAVVSNTAQYYDSGSGFGGMSGVVFAVMAYCWMWDRLRPERGYHFPAALMGLMLFWLVLGFTDMLRLLGFGAIANTAHLVGLLFGLVFAMLTSQVDRFVR